MQPPQELQPAGLHDIGGLFGPKALTSCYMPQQRVQFRDDLAERGGLAVPGPHEASADAGRPVGRGITDAVLAVTKCHNGHATTR